MPKGNTPSQPTSNPTVPRGQETVQQLTPKKPSKFKQSGDLTPASLTPRVIPRTNMENWAYNTISQKQLGYTPTWAQNPRAITGAMQLIKSTPMGQPLPYWIENQKEQIHQAFEWYKLRNKGKPANEWKYLPQDDAGMNWLSTLQGPPEPEEIAEANAPFVGKDAVLKGEAAWTDLSPEERTSILADKSFQISQFPVPVRDQILNDPAFDWSRLPAWQKTYYELMSNPAIMASPMALAGARAGRILGPVGSAIGAGVGFGLGYIGGQEYDPTGGVTDQPTLVAGMMAVLNKLSEGAEQSAGFSAEFIDAALAGMQGNEQAAESAKKMIFDKDYRKATWEAGRFAYEASDFLGARNWMPALQLLAAMSDTSGTNILSKADRDRVAREHNITFAAPGQDFVIGQAAPVDRAVAFAINPATGNRYQTNDPMGILQEIRLTIHKAIVDGEDPREVIRQILGEQSQYVGATVADFAGQMVIDPLEILPDVTNATSFMVARQLGNETAARAFMETNAPYEAARRYKTLVESGDVPASFDYTAMGSVSRWVAGLNEKGEIRAGPFTSTGLLDAPSPAKRQGLLNKIKEDWAALTPEARAQEGANMFYNNIAAFLSMIDDPHEVARKFSILSKGDFKTWRAMGERLGNSPEWYTILPILKDFKAETLDGFLASWDLAGPKREALVKIAEVLGEEPAKFLDDLAARGTAEQDFVRLTARLQESAAPEAKALLEQINQGAFTATHLKDIVEAFTGDAAMAWHPGQWKAQLLDAMGAHADEWIANKLELGKDEGVSKAFFRTAHLLKSAQSVLLLGGSPGYALTNGLSGMVSRMITGNYGYMGAKQIDTWLNRFGVTPARIEEGVGIGGNVEQVASRTSVQTKAIQAAIRGNQNGPLGRAQRIVSAIGRGMPFNKLSSWFERVEGKNGYMIAMRDMWARTWKRGVGFREMTPQLRSAVEAAGINPGHIYNMIEAGMNKAEIERFIFGRQKGVNARSLVHGAAQKLGITTPEAQAMLEKIGVLDQLNTLLERAGTPDAIRQAFTRARRTASDHQDMQTQRDLLAIAEQVTNKVGTEGAVAALDTVQQVSTEFFDAWQEHYGRFGELMTNLTAIPDPATRSRAIDMAYEASDADFRRVMARTAATYKGIFDAWKMDHNAEATQFLHSISEVDRSMRTAYDFMREARRQFFESIRTAEDPFAKEHTAEWKRVQKEIDRAFKDAFERKKQAETRMGDALAVLYEQRYGPAAGAAAKKWWTDYVRFADEIAKREQKFRKSIENLTKDEREAAKQKYYSTDKVAQIAELERINKEGIERLQRMVKRGKGPGAAAAPQQPTQPTPPAAPPGMAMPPEQALRAGFAMQQARPSRVQVDQEVSARLEQQRHQPSERELAELEESNRLIAEAAQRDAQERIDKANHVKAVWDVAEGYWARGGNFSRETFQDRFNLLGALKKAEYGGIPDVKDLGDPRLTPELVRQVLETRKAIKEAEAVAQSAQMELMAAERARLAEQDRMKQLKKAQPFLQINENTSILQAIKWLGGIALDRAADLTGEKKPKGNPGLFTKKGLAPDEMARELASYDYAIDLTRPDDPDGIRQMTELLNEARRGNKVLPTTHVVSDAEINKAEAAWAERQQAERPEGQSPETASEIPTPEEAMQAPFDVADWEARVMLASQADDLNALYELIGDLPPELGTAKNWRQQTYNDWFSEIADDTATRVEEANRMDDIAEEMYQIEETMREMETRSDARMSARLLREKMQQAFGLSDAQADAYMELTETFANWYSSVTGESPDGFYSRYFADVRREATDGALFQDQAAPVWFHRSVQVVEAIKQESMTVDQLRGIINKNGVKADELKWTGLDDYLNGRTKVTKTEVLNYLRENRVDVQEIVKQTPENLVRWDDMQAREVEMNTALRTYERLRNQAVGMLRDNGIDSQTAREIVDAHIENDGVMLDETREDLEKVGLDPNAFDDEVLSGVIDAQEDYRRAQMDYDEAKAGDEAAPKYEEYVLPGDYTNYREILFTLPTRDVQPVQPRPAIRQDPSKYTIEVIDDSKMQYYGQRDVRVLYDGAWTGSNRYSTRLTDAEIIQEAIADDQRRAEEATRDRQKKADEANNYKSGHWDEPNVLAHTRLTERTDADGKRVLVIEEIQSDWHQAGREKGYKVAPFEGKLSDWIRKQGYTPEAFEKLPIDKQIEIEVAYGKAKAGDDGIGAVPDAPFAKNWHELTMKRVLRLAAEEGYDRVAWTTGQQQSARWSKQLQQQVDRLTWEPKRQTDTGGILMGELVGYKGGSKVFSQTVPASEMPGMIGQEVAAQLLETHAVEGADIKVGGSGMHGFYDNMLVSWANKYAKKWGARVGETSVPGPDDVARTTGWFDARMREEDGEFVVETFDGDEWNDSNWFDTRAEAEAEVASIKESNAYGTKLHSIDVTPEMTKSVLEGQTLFQRADPKARLNDARLDYKQVTKSRTEWIDAAVEEFGTYTDVDQIPRELTAYYVLPDGRIIAMEGHESITKVLPENITNGVDQFEAQTGAIRWWAGDFEGYIDFVNALPTPEQLTTLRVAFRKVAPTEKLTFDIRDANGNALLTGELDPTGRGISKVVDYAKRIFEGTEDVTSLMRRTPDGLAWQLDNTVGRYEYEGQRDLFQIEPINRRMNAPEIDGYARALVRSGPDELRRAVRNEPNQADRIAILDAAHKINPKMAESVARSASDVLFQEVWHGTPHRFEKFSLEKVNTGEGAQAFGWGLYFAQRKGIAESYRQNLLDRRGANTRGGVIVDGIDASEDGWKYTERMDAMKEQSNIQRKIAQLIMRELNYKPDAATRLVFEADLGFDELKQVAADSNLPELDSLADQLRNVTNLYRDLAREQTAWMLVENQVRAHQSHQKDPAAILDAARGTLSAMHYSYDGMMKQPDLDQGTRQSYQKTRDEYMAALEFMDNHKIDIRSKNEGQLFKVDIPDEGFLMWDEKIGKQPELQKLLPKEKRKPFTKKMKDELAHLNDIANDKAKTPAGEELDVIYKEMNEKYGGWSFADWTPEERARYDDTYARYESERDALQERFNELRKTPGAPLAWDEAADLRSDNNTYKAESAFDEYEIRPSRDGKYYELHSTKGRSVISAQLSEGGRDTLMKRAQQMDAALAKKGPASMTGQEFYEAMVERHATKVSFEHPEWSQRQVEFEAQRRASLELNAAGLTGIKYLDGSSRNKKTGTYNFVIFDDEAINIMETYYQRGLAATTDHTKPGTIKGSVAFGPDGVQGTIKAFAAADFSTAVHETFHVYRRVLTDVAQRTQDPKVLADLRTIEEWAGVENGVWIGNRAAEEKFARAFERYLAEGNAPTLRLKAAFDNFKRWLLDIYRTIMGSSIDVDITPEVRQVFDRLLGAERPATPERARPARKGPLDQIMEQPIPMFPDGGDLPLMSGTPQRAAPERVRPAEARQEPLFTMAPTQARRSKASPRTARTPAGQLDLPTPEAARPDPTSTPEFQQWFGASKVVDPEGKPMVVYHGTNADFTEFEMQSRSHGVDAAYFSDDPGTAESYAALGTLDDESPAVIMPAYLKMENPLILDETREAKGYKQTIEDVKRAKEAGHDGVIIKGALDDQGLRFGEEGIDWENFKTEEMVGDGEALPTNIYIVFDNKQIKSTANQGTFDPNDPNVLHQRGGFNRSRLDQARIAYKAPKRTDWSEAAVQEFGTIKSLDEAGRRSALFTLQDGRTIALEQHEDILSVVPEKTVAGVDQFAAQTGAVRWWTSKHETYIDFNNTVPTPQQIRVIKRWVADHGSDTISFDIRDANGDTIVKADPEILDASPRTIDQIVGYARRIFEGQDDIDSLQQRSPVGYDWQGGESRNLFQREPDELYQIDVGDALQQAGGDRRDPAFQRLRRMWDQLDPASQQEALDWILNRTMTDPLSGLETLVAMSIEGVKPDGWITATSDLNALTAINNTWGHGAGDQLITVVGQIAKAEVTAAGGRAFRVGGDEFTYWFPDEAAARTALENIDRRVSEQTVNVGGKDRKGFSISYGIGENPHSADTALYTDKLRRIKTGQRPEVRDQMPSSVQLIGEAPLGTMENAAAFTPESAWMDEGWRQHVDPLLDAMQDEALQQKPMDGAMKDMSAEGQKMLRQYVQQVQSDMGATKMSTMKWGESQRDFALLNYNRRFGADKALEVPVPYQFFYTRSLLNYAMRGLDKPAMYAKYARIRNLQNEHERDIPERLRNRIKISAPWMPDWMGDSLYIDPLKTLFPIDGFLRPLETMNRDKNMQMIETERVLQEWMQDGQVQEGEAFQAAQSQTGPLWERAAAEATTRREAEIQNPFDFMSQMLGPAWYLSTPLNMLGVEIPGISKGDKAKVSPTPLLNTTRAFETVTEGTWAEPVGKIIGAFGKPEQWIREKSGLPEYGEFGDYYVDRQLANMVADGLITSQQASQAMIERQGETFDQARQRVQMELAMRVPLAGATLAATHEGPGAAAAAFVPSLFGSGLLPAGELEFRGLKKEWDAAWKRADKGDKTAINAFFEKHPEYEAWLQKGKTPEDKLRSHLIGNIWDAYMELGETHKKQARMQMGQDFQMAFLDKETRNYESLNVQQLAEWSQMLGKMVPKTPETQPVIDQPGKGLDLYDPAVSDKTDQFFADRKEKFPDYHMLESGYYDQPPSQRASYLLKFPRLKEYWNFKEDFTEANPKLKPIISGKVFKQIDTSTWPMGLQEYVVAYAMTGKPLPKGASLALEQQWIREGQPLGDYRAWLDSQVVPAMLYAPQQQGAMQPQPMP